MCAFHMHIQIDTHPNTYTYTRTYISIKIRVRKIRVIQNWHHWPKAGAARSRQYTKENRKVREKE